VILRVPPGRVRRTPSGTAAVLLTLVLLLAGCRRPGPRAIAYGSESCAHCHMTIADPRFSAELLTRTGKAIPFDDVGCLAAWLAEHALPVAGSWVVSFTDSRWIRADSATYLHTDRLHTPMASGLVALRPGREADSVQALLGGWLLSWPEVLSRPHDHSPAAAPSS
jgi:copper chaperone NosL